MVIWSPRPGESVNSALVALRGFLCEPFPVIVVDNRTTHRTQVVDTTPLCEGSDCVYAFAALVKNLVPGPNHLIARTPDGRYEVAVEVIRSALVRH